MSPEARFWQVFPGVSEAAVSGQRCRISVSDEEPEI
jgi:hypothetical protein